MEGQILTMSAFCLAGLQITVPKAQAEAAVAELWARFLHEPLVATIPDYTEGSVYTVCKYAVPTGPNVTLFIGYKVRSLDKVPDGLQTLEVPEGAYQLFLARGPMPETRAQAWRQINSGQANRAYTYDFEIYGPKAQQGSFSELEIYVSTLDKEPQQA